jgi:hypothetical protein
MIKRFAPLLLVATLALAGTVQAAPAKKATDVFAEFKGSFKGSASFVVSPGESALTGSGTLVVSGPKNGRSITLNFAGTVASGATVSPYSNTITISKNGAYTASAGVFNLVNTATLPFSGRVSIKKKTISGSGAFTLVDAPATVTFSIQSHTSGKKRTLTINYLVTNSFASFPFQFVVTGKAK